MRLALAAAIVVTVTGTAVFLACSSKGLAPEPTPTDGGTTDGSSSGSSSSGAIGDAGAQTNLDEAAIDGGCGVATNVTCKLHCTGYQTGATFTSTARTDITNAVAWDTPANAATQDGQFATVTLADGEESAFLDATNFDFSGITDDKATYGVAVEFTRESVNTALDSKFTIIVANPHPNLPVDHQDQGVWPEGMVGTHHYGQCVDTWQLDLNPVDVRPTTFGARVSVKRGPDAGTDPVVAHVDSMRVNVCYCNADGK